MPKLDIVSERLRRQRISGQGFADPADLVRWMGAVQAQDYAAAKWAVGLRTRACTDSDLEEAFTQGKILRTHVMRPTWHFVAPEDIRWLQALTASRVGTILSYQYRQLKLDAPLLRRSDGVIHEALQGGKQLTRAELGQALARARIPTNGLRLAHILSHAELEALVCSGGRRGRQFTYALVEERAPQAAARAREDALAELTRRYFTSHGPATLQDFSWWSGLASADIKAGVESVKTELAERVVDGQSYWTAGEVPSARRPAHGTMLLTNYDEYIVGYADRRAIFDDVHATKLDARHNPLFQNTILSEGRIVGTWQRTLRLASVSVRLRPFRRTPGFQAAEMEAAVQRYAKFLGLQLAKA